MLKTAHLKCNTYLFHIHFFIFPYIYTRKEQPHNSTIEMLGCCGVVFNFDLIRLNYHFYFFEPLHKQRLLYSWLGHNYWNPYRRRQSHRENYPDKVAALSISCHRCCRRRHRFFMVGFGFSFNVGFIEKKWSKMISFLKFNQIINLVKWSKCQNVRMSINFKRLFCCCLPNGWSSKWTQIEIASFLKAIAHDKIWFLSDTMRFDLPH